MSCERDGWEVCNLCGALVESDYHGAGYLPEDYTGECLCPDCAPAATGFAATVALLRTPPFAAGDA